MSIESPPEIQAAIDAHKAAREEYETTLKMLALSVEAHGAKMPVSMFDDYSKRLKTGRRAMNHAAEHVIELRETAGL